MDHVWLIYNSFCAFKMDPGQSRTIVKLMLIAYSILIDVGRLYKLLSRDSPDTPIYVTAIIINSDVNHWIYSILL